MDAINGSKLAWGVAAMMLNLGARNISADLTPLQQRIMAHPAVKSVAVACMFFMATRDILLSVSMASVFVMVVDVLTREGSAFCLLPGARCGVRPQFGPINQPMHNVVSRALTAAVSPPPQQQHAPPQMPPPRQAPPSPVERFETAFVPLTSAAAPSATTPRAP